MNTVKVKVPGVLGYPDRVERSRQVALLKVRPGGTE